MAAESNDPAGESGAQYGLLPGPKNPNCRIGSIQKSVWPQA